MKFCKEIHSGFQKSWIKFWTYLEKIFFETFFWGSITMQTRFDTWNKHIELWLCFQSSLSPRPHDPQISHAPRTLDQLSSPRKLVTPESVRFQTSTSAPLRFWQCRINPMDKLDRMPWGADLPGGRYEKNRKNKKNCYQ